MWSTLTGTCRDQPETHVGVIAMGALVLFVAGFYLFFTGKRQSGLVYEPLDDLMGEDVAGLMCTTMGGAFIAVAAFWGLSYAMT